jgi:type IV fimbrial biogenesis protein FimT
MKAARVCSRLNRGLSLIELLVVLAIAAVLFGIGMPALGGMLRAQRLRLAAGDFLGAVELTRGQAVALGQRVTLAPTSSATLDWADGWTVFIDRNGDRRPDAGDDIIMRHPALVPSAGSGAVRFSMNFGTQQGPPYLAYNSMGRGCSYLSSAVARFGTMTLAQGEYIRRVKINMQGRARLCDPARDGASCEGAAP